MKNVELYTDGACRGNPGKGGYGTILRYKDHEKEMAKGFLLTTNNRMELLAVIVGLEALQEICHIDIYSDSKYIVDNFTKGYAHNWRKKNWCGSNKKPIKNIDLWERLLDLCDKQHITMHWVKGHSGHIENERADELACVAADADESTLLEDTNYLKEVQA